MTGSPARAWCYPIVVALVAPMPASAQLTITAAPLPTQVRPGTALIFSGQVLQSKASLLYMRVGRCFKIIYRTTYHDGTPLPECLSSSWHTEAITVAYLPHPQAATISFSDTYIVPNTAAPGDSLCFSLEQSTSGAPTTFKAGFPVCRIVTALPLSRQRTPVATAVPAIPPGSGSPGGAGDRVAQPAPRRTTAAAGTSSGPARATRAGGPLGVPRAPQHPDLTVTFEKAPWAKWVIRNDGGAASTPTTFQLSRAGVPEKVIQIPALAPGTVHEIVVTPGLDAYLVNAWGVVDPKNFVVESNEANNTWKSAESR